MFIPKDFQNVYIYENKLKNNTSNYWMNKGEKMAFNLFRMMAKRVPAYKDFLKKNKIHPDKIRNIEDFKNIPILDKSNYLRSYPLEYLCWDGNIRNKKWTISATSGSTGEPFYFPREKDQDWQYALTAELYLRTNFNIDKKSTLYIVGFAMGAWIGGIFTYEAIKTLAEHGNYNLSVITPGIYKKEIIKAVRQLGNSFDQIIIGGYPPFIKAAIDEGIEDGLDWKKYNLGFIFSAEGFTESFRDYIIKKTGLSNYYKDTLNHYGTVDLGTMAHETPLSILARRIALKNKKLYKSLFLKDHKIPTFAQYNPELFYFEEVEKRLICSAFSGIPLVRYDLKDQGGIITFKKLQDIFMNQYIDLLEEAKKVSITDTIWNLPFVYVFDRIDFVVKLYGANIYPETIRKALQHASLEKYITGRFTMIIKFDRTQNQYLEINIELKRYNKSSSKLKKLTQSLLIKRLLKENSEYQSNYKEAPKRQKPHIVFWEYEHPLYFTTGSKQKWVK